MHRAAPAPDLGARVDEAIAEALVVAFGVMVVHTEITLWQTCSHSRDLSVSELSASKVRRSFQAVNTIVTRSIGLALNGPFCVDPACRRGFRDPQPGANLGPNQNGQERMATTTRQPSNPPGGLSQRTPARSPHQAIDQGLERAGPYTVDQDLGRQHVLQKDAAAG
jgi:hypothetical protein